MFHQWQLRPHRVVKAYPLIASVLLRTRLLTVIGLLKVSSPFAVRDYGTSGTLSLNWRTRGKMTKEPESVATILERELDCAMKE